MGVTTMATMRTRKRTGRVPMMLVRIRVAMIREERRRRWW